MATLAEPGLDHIDGPKRPNIARAGLQLPAVKDYAQVDREIIATLRPTKAWFTLLMASITCLGIGAASWIYQIYSGLGVAGYSPPVMWGVYIITFVFWIGIGHAGTLISAILYLFRAGFRTTIYRCAEAMTVFAVMTAGLFPIIHIGRPWKFFWLSRTRTGASCGQTSSRHSSGTSSLSRRTSRFRSRFSSLDSFPTSRRCVTRKRIR